MKQTVGHKRSRLLINRRFQYHFLGAIILVELLIVALTGPISFAFYMFSADPAMLDDWYFRLPLIAMSVCLIAALLALLYVGLSFSNRVSGPVHRTKDVCRAICHGQLPESVHFRKKDFHQDLSVAVNEALRVLRQSRESEIVAWREQAGRLAELAAVLDATAAGRLQELISDAEKMATNLERSLGRTA